MPTGAQLAKQGRARLEVINAKNSELYKAKARRYIDSEWKKYNKAVPTVEGLAIYLDVTRVTIYENTELKPYLEELQTLQANIALDKGLTGDFNSNIVKLLLSSKHGYVEKTEQQVTNVNVDANQALANSFADYIKQETSKTIDDQAQT